MALRAIGVGSTATVIRKAVAFLKRDQNRDGGFRYYSGYGGSTTSSTSLAAQGIVAHGKNPFSSYWKSNGKTPSSFLRSKQNSRYGCFYHLGKLKSAPLLSISHAVMALKKKRLPL